MCDHQRLRPACAYAQSDQSLRLSLEYSMSVKLLTEHCLEFLSLKGGCAGSSETTLVKMPHCWKLCVMAQLILKHFPEFSAEIFKINFFKSFFQEYHLSGKQFGFRSGPTKNVVPDLDLNCLQRLSADDTCNQRVKLIDLVGEIQQNLS